MLEDEYDKNNDLFDLEHMTIEAFILQKNTMEIISLGIHWHTTISWFIPGDSWKSMHLDYHRFHKSYFIKEYAITTCKPFYLYGIPYLLGLDALFCPLDGGKIFFH